MRKHPVMRRLMAWLLMLLLCFGGAAPAKAAEETSASAMRLVKTEGEVTVTNGSGKSMTLRENMRLYNGYTVTTGVDSYAWISLDDAKAIKLNLDSAVEIRQNGKQLELLIQKGEMFFGVSEHLGPDERMSIRTSSMITGIRGTFGFAGESRRGWSRTYLLGGRVEGTILDPETGESRRVVVEAGDIVDYLSKFGMWTEISGSIVVDKLSKQAVDGFVLVELAGMSRELVNLIFQESGLDLRNVTLEGARKRLAEDEAKAREAGAGIRPNVSGRNGLRAGVNEVKVVWKQPMVEPTTVTRIQEPQQNPPGEQDPQKEQNPEEETAIITWQNEDGSTIDTTEVEYGTTPRHVEPTKASTAEYDYTFTGWTPEVAVVTGVATYKATFEATRRSYVITWQDENGTTIDTTEVEYGTTPERADPEKASTAEYDYTFTGWTPEVAPVTGEATYKATFEATRRSYAITWQNEDGSTIDTTEVEYGVAPKHADPEKASTSEYDYTFTGWTPEVVAVNGEATYKATFEATRRSYVITWQNEDGTTIDTTEVEYGIAPKHVEPTKAPTAEYTYTFTGWTPEVVPVTGEATYTATFTAEKNKYTVTWKNSDGELLAEEQVEYGTRPGYPGETPKLEPTPQYSYTFAGWDKEIKPVTENVTYTATYDSRVNEYTVTWQDSDGTELQKEKAAYGTTPEYTGDQPTREATAEYTYTFAGWTPEIETVTEDVTYTATYTSRVNEYTVTWQDSDGTELQKEKAAYGTTPEYTGDQPTREATAEYTYTFTGWTPEIETVTGDVTYTATYDSRVNEYTVTWQDSDGTELKKEKAAYGTTPEYTGDQPTREATAEYTYTFTGWTPEIETVTEDVTYTATYDSRVNEYTVTWQNSDGTELKKEKAAYGTTPEYTGDQPTREATAEYSYTFAGWAPDLVPVTGEATYTATFAETRRSYPITWLNDSGRVIDTTTAEYGTAPTHADATKASTEEYDYTFTGWTPELVPVTGAATYTATFEATKRSYIITWQNDDGSRLGTTAVEYGEMPTYHTPKKMDSVQYSYAFAGWTPELTAVSGDATYTAKYTATERTGLLKIQYEATIIQADREANVSVTFNGEPTTQAAPGDWVEVSITAVEDGCGIAYAEGSADNQYIDFSIHEGVAVGGFTMPENAVSLNLSAIVGTMHTLTLVTEGSTQSSVTALLGGEPVTRAAEGASITLAAEPTPYAMTEVWSSEENLEFPDPRSFLTDGNPCFYMPDETESENVTITVHLTEMVPVYIKTVMADETQGYVYATAKADVTGYWFDGEEGDDEGGRVWYPLPFSDTEDFQWARKDEDIRLIFSCYSDPDDPTQYQMISLTINGVEMLSTPLTENASYKITYDVTATGSTAVVATFEAVRDIVVEPQG